MNIVIRTGRTCQVFARMSSLDITWFSMQDRGVARFGKERLINRCQTEVLILPVALWACSVSLSSWYCPASLGSAAIPPSWWHFPEASNKTNVFDLRTPTATQLIARSNHRRRISWLDTTNKLVPWWLGFRIVVKSGLRTDYSNDDWPSISNNVPAWPERIIRIASWSNRTQQKMSRDKASVQSADTSLKRTNTQCCSGTTEMLVLYADLAEDATVIVY